MTAEVFEKKSNVLNHTFVKLESQSLIVRNYGLYGLLFIKLRGRLFQKIVSEKSRQKIQKKEEQNVS